MRPSTKAVARLAILLVLPLVPLAAEARESLVVVCDDNYPPYVFRGGDGEIQGILVDQWRAWEESTGVRVDLRAMDWFEALAEMRLGRADVIDTVFRTPEREALWDFTPPYADIEVPVFVHHDVAGIAKPQDLRGFRVGGAARWQDRIAIGYPYVRDANGNEVADLKRPYFGPDSLLVDLNCGYRTKFDFLTRRIDCDLGVNLINAFADDKMIPIVANADGSWGTVRIPPERTWTVVTSFRF